MQQAFADQNAQLVAVYQVTDESLSTQQQNELAYTVLSDVSNSLAKVWLGIHLR